MTEQQITCPATRIRCLREQCRTASKCEAATDYSPLARLSIANMISEAKREVALRKAVYPGLIARGKMSKDEASRRQWAMESVLRMLIWCEPRESELRAMKEGEGDDQNGR